MSATARAIVVHRRAHAEAALAAAAALGVPVVLRSPPAAAGYLGPAYFLAMIENAARAHPTAVFQAVLDCGDAPGHALAALRRGLGAVRLAADEAVLARVADIAGQYGAALDRDPAPPLDLGALPSRRWAEACAAWLDAGRSA